MRTKGKGKKMGEGQQQKSNKTLRAGTTKGRSGPEGPLHTQVFLFSGFFGGFWRVFGRWPSIFLVIHMAVRPSAASKVGMGWMRANATRKEKQGWLALTGCYIDTSFNNVGTAGNLSPCLWLLKGIYIYF
jgi:hypothetical protein